jgi:hypothetical protein
MGLYSPWITEPVAGSAPSTGLPEPATPIACPPGKLSCTACDVYPDGLPAIISPTNQTCSVEPSNPITITKVVTQCAIPPAPPGCTDGVIVQSNPPINIIGQGFGYFSLGLPYTGNSNFVQITDTTQVPNWSAGYTGDPCTVSIGEWSDGQISLIANVNQGGACPMAAGDNLNITVWNQQSQKSFLFSVGVSASSGDVTRKR